MADVNIPAELSAIAEKATARHFNDEFEKTGKWDDACERTVALTLVQCTHAICTFCRGPQHVHPGVNPIPGFVSKGYIPNYGDWAGGFMHQTEWGVPYSCDASAIYMLAEGHDGH